LWRASGQFALTWQIARQQESATVGHQLVGSSGELLVLYASSAHKSSETVAIPGGRLGPSPTLRVVVIGKRGKIVRSNNPGCEKRGG